MTRREMLNDLFASVEKIAAKSTGITGINSAMSPLNQLLGLLGRGAPQDLITTLSKKYKGDQTRAIGEVATTLSNSLKKPVENKLKAKKPSPGDLPNIFSKTTDALFDGKNSDALLSSAGTGAVTGAIGGALVDPDEETTNALGMPQTRKGGIAKRLQNAAAGATIGAAGFGGLKARGIAKKEINQMAENLKGKLPANYKGTTDDVIRAAVSNLTPEEINQAGGAALDKLIAGLPKKGLSVPKAQAALSNSDLNLVPPKMDPNHPWLSAWRMDNYNSVDPVFSKGRNANDFMELMRGINTIEDTNVDIADLLNRFDPEGKGSLNFLRNLRKDFAQIGDPDNSENIAKLLTLTDNAYRDYANNRSLYARLKLWGNQRASNKWNPAVWGRYLTGSYMNPEDYLNRVVRQANDTSKRLYTNVND